LITISRRQIRERWLSIGGGLVAPGDHHSAAQLLETRAEVFLQGCGVGRSRVVDDRGGARRQVVIGKLGRGRRLDVVAETGEEEMLWHQRRQLGRSRARGHEDEPVVGDGRRGREHHVGIREPDHCRQRGLRIDQPAGTLRSQFETALGVGDHQLDLPPEHAAFGIGARHGELGAPQ
jgi:hypothetical protein